MVEKRIRTWVICSQAPDDKSVGWLDTTVWDQWQIKVYHDDGWKTVKAIDDDELQAQIQEIIEALNNRYTKSETYSKSEVNNLFSNFSGFIVVETLPETGDATKIYLVGPSGSTQDKYEEYIYSNNTWTKIGDTGIDLTGYVKTTSTSTSGNIAVFDGASGTFIHDGGPRLWELGIGNNSIKAISATTSSGTGSVASGYFAVATAMGAHAEGYDCKSKGMGSHAEGWGTLADEYCGAHAEGELTKAKNKAAHAEGTATTASGDSSHVEGKGTVSNNISEHAEGQYNISISGVTQHTIGIGTSSVPKNAHTITIDGKHYIPGIGTYVGTETTLPTGQDLATIVNAKANSSSLATVATSGSYTDLSNKPTIPTVNDAILTIQKNGVDVQTFSANASSNITANITVPTQASDINAAAATHTHTTSITTDSGTADIALAYGGQYKLSAGGTNVVFTMPATSTSDVFWATYGISTYNEIRTALESNKEVLMRYAVPPDGDEIRLFRASWDTGQQDGIYFSCTDGYTMIETSVDTNDGWDSMNSYIVESISNRVSSLTGNTSATNRYPNCKAVADYVDNKDQIKYPAGTYAYGSHPNIFLSNGNIVCWDKSAGSYSISLDAFYEAYMKSIGSYDASIASSLSAKEKIKKLSFMMANNCIIRVPAGSTTITKTLYTYMSVISTGGSFVIDGIEYGASSSGTRISLVPGTAELSIVD